MPASAIITTTLDVLKNYHFEEPVGTAMVLREPIGVVGMITPWNWPLNQIACKVAPALAAGCTMILKPCEFTPDLGADLRRNPPSRPAACPKGVFNLVNGLGPEVGAAMGEHPDIDMISFTGSTRAGIDRRQARRRRTVKRVAQELGGKSPNLILEDADLQTAVTGGVKAHASTTPDSPAMRRRGCWCRRPDDEGSGRDRQGRVADKAKTGDPRPTTPTIGPVVNALPVGQDPGADQEGHRRRRDAGHRRPRLPEGLNRGFYVRPTVFADVTNDMTIAREEIFGPVLSIIGPRTRTRRSRIANDTPYGLAAYVSGDNVESARRVARRLRAGNVNLNGAPNERAAPFGGYKQSGNGREWGRSGLEEYLEVKAVAGYNAA